MNPHAPDTLANRRRDLRASITVLIAFATISLADIVHSATEAETQRRAPATEPAQTEADPYAAFRDWSGLQIMREVQRRHEQFPYVYEEQTMVLMDVQGHRATRKIRRFSRAEEDDSVKFLLVFDDPEEIRGVALLAVRDSQGDTVQGVYLPAFGAEFKEPAPGSRSGHFLGTDFSIDDLTTEVLDEHRYVRGRDRLRENVEFFVVDAYPANTKIERRSGYALRRHLIRKDIFMIVRTDFFDRHLRFMKRMTHHDLQRVSGESWRANMIVVSDEREKHRTLLKVDRRIYSRDYVPAELFSRDFLLGNGHVGSLSDRIPGHAPKTPKRTKAAKAATKGVGDAMSGNPPVARSTGQ